MFPIDPIQRRFTFFQIKNSVTPQEFSRYMDIERKNNPRLLDRAGFNTDIVVNLLYYPSTTPSFTKDCQEDTKINLEKPLDNFSIETKS